MILKVETLGGKLDANSWFRLMGEFVGGKSREQVGFSHPRISDINVRTSHNYQLKKVIELVANYWFGHEVYR